MLFSHLLLGLLCCLLPSDFPTEILYSYLFPVRATCPAHLVLHDWRWPTRNKIKFSPQLTVTYHPIVCRTPSVSEMKHVGGRTPHYAFTLYKQTSIEIFDKVARRIGKRFHGIPSILSIPFFFFSGRFLRPEGNPLCSVSHFYTKVWCRSRGRGMPATKIGTSSSLVTLHFHGSAADVNTCT
jgi:hypothetical protein